MEATQQNIDMVRDKLAFELIFMKEKHADNLDERQIKKLDEEIDSKIAKMLPNYSGNIPVKDAFGDILKRTIENFVK